MRRGTLRALSVVAGVLLIIAGVVCLCHQETAALSAKVGAWAVSGLPMSAASRESMVAACSRVRGRWG